MSKRPVTFIGIYIHSTTRAEFCIVDNGVELLNGTASIEQIENALNHYYSVERVCITCEALKPVHLVIRQSNHGMSSIEHSEITWKPAQYYDGIKPIIERLSTLAWSKE